MSPTAEISGGTDNHYGHPGSYGEGLTGLYAPELTRHAVFDAIRKRRTYAVTGDRIELQFGMAGGNMGDIISSSSSRDISCSVLARDEIDYVALVKNGIPVEKWTSPVPPHTSNKAVHMVRLEWGWGGMTSTQKTRRHIEISVESGDCTKAEQR